MRPLRACFWPEVVPQSFFATITLGKHLGGDDDDAQDDDDDHYDDDAVDADDDDDVEWLRDVLSMTVVYASTALLAAMP